MMTHGIAHTLGWIGAGVFALALALQGCGASATSEDEAQQQATAPPPVQRVPAPSDADPVAPASTGPPPTAAPESEPLAAPADSVEFAEARLTVGYLPPGFDGYDTKELPGRNGEVLMQRLYRNVEAKAQIGIGVTTGLPSDQQLDALAAGLETFTASGGPASVMYRWTSPVGSVHIGWVADPNTTVWVSGLSMAKLQSPLVAMRSPHSSGLFRPSCSSWLLPSRVLLSCGGTRLPWPPAERKAAADGGAGPFERVEGLYLHPDHRRRLRRLPVKGRLDG